MQVTLLVRLVFVTFKAFNKRMKFEKKSYCDDDDDDDDAVDDDDDDDDGLCVIYL